MILVTGCPRSGTTFVSRLAHRYGYDLGHEKMGRDGTVSYAFAVDDADYLWCHEGERRSDFDFALVVHLVRHPIHCIPSIAVMVDSLAPFVQRHIGPLIGRTPIERAADMWLRWNTIIEPQAHFRVRVEDICDAGLGRVVNAREHIELSPRNQRALLGLHAGNVAAMAAKYGYCMDGHE